MTKERPVATKQTSDGITLPAGRFAGAMRSAADIVAARNTIPILSNVLLRADGAKLDIATTNLDIDYRQSLPLDSAGSIDITVSAAKLTAIAGALDPGAPMTLTVKDGALAVSSGRSRWRLPTIPTADFPSPPDIVLCEPVTMDGAALAGALSRVKWAMAVACTEKSRTHLHGIYIHEDGGRLRIAAAFHAGLASLHTAEAFPKGADSAMLAADYVTQLIKLASDHASPVTLAWSDRGARAVIGETVLTGMLIDSQFLDYRRAIPAPVDVPIVVDPGDIVAAQRRGQPVADERTRGVRLERLDGAIAISSSPGASLSFREEISAECSEGAYSEVNGQYLGLIAGAIGGDSIEVHQAEPGASGSPIMFRRVVDDGSLAVIMPMMA
jgi:DNA polymerase III subunit beta